MIKEINKKIGEKLKLLREKHNFTQKELAEKIGCSQQFISMSEKGKISTIPALLEFCEIYDIGLDYFDMRKEGIGLKENKLIKPEATKNTNFVTLEEFNRLRREIEDIKLKIKIN